MTLTLPNSYLLVPQGLGAAIIDAGVNFGIGK